MDWRAIRAAVEAYVQGWRTADRESWLALFAEDAVVEDPAGAPPFVGKESIGDFWDRTRSLGMSMRPEVTRIVVCGNEAVLVFRMTAVASDGSGMALDVCDVFSFNAQGRIRQLKAYWDKGCMKTFGPASTA
jgi:steroid delta-isomerase